MAKKTFYGASMAFGDVSSYYRNPAWPNFGGFVFQQMIDDGTAADDDYTLTAFAVDIYGVPLSQTPLPMTTLYGSSIPAKKKVQFANMKLNLVDLAKLYPGSNVSQLTVIPKKFFKTTGYVIYEADTPDFVVILTPRATPLNPSPPY